MVYVTSKTLKKNKIDIVVLVSVPILAAIVSLLFKLNFLISTVLFYGVPCLYLSVRTPKAILRTLVYTATFILLGGIMIDYLAVADQSWYVPTIFPYLVFGFVPIEGIVWFLLLVYLIIIFYEHFLDKGVHKIFDKHYKYGVFIVISIFVIFCSLLTFNKQLLQIPYFYALFGAVLVLLPIIVTKLMAPRVFTKIIKVAPYFISLSLLNEFTAIELGYWSFHGQHFIGWFILFGLKIPFEAMFFYIFLFSTSLLAFFEFFDDSIHARFKFIN